MLVARFLFPKVHIALIDTDCAPVSSFEIQEFILLRQAQVAVHMGTTAPGGFLNAQVLEPGMILFSEQYLDINAGLVDLTAQSVSLPQSWRNNCSRYATSLWPLPHPGKLQLPFLSRVL